MAPEDEDDDDAADSAWFHYLKLPKLGTVELVPGKAFRMGREARNELVLTGSSQDLVATVFWSDDYDEATLKEHGASEPIKVDGVRITGVRTLKGGEELEVGPLRMQYLKRATPIEDAIDAKRLARRGSPAPGKAFDTPADGGRAARGALDPNAKQLGGEKVDLGVRRPGQRVALEPNQRGSLGSGSGTGPAARPTGPAARPSERAARPTEPAARPSGAGPARARNAVGAAPAEVARALEKVQASGTLRIKSPQGRGWVQVVAGKPTYAAFAGLSGRAALEAILRLPRGSCQVVRGAPGRGQGERLTVTFSQLLGKASAPAAPRPGPPARPAPGAVRRPPPGRR
jgi:hypothetical protein